VIPSSALPWARRSCRARSSALPRSPTCSRRLGARAGPPCRGVDGPRRPACILERGVRCQCRCSAVLCCAVPCLASPSFAARFLARRRPRLATTLGAPLLILTSHAVRDFAASCSPEAPGPASFAANTRLGHSSTAHPYRARPSPAPQASPTSELRLRAASICAAPGRPHIASPCHTI
jgi:hypothetical protein